MFPTRKPWKFWEKKQTLRDAVKIVVQGGSYQKATRETGVSYQLIRKFHLKHVIKPGLKEFFKQNPSLLDVKNDSKHKEEDFICTVFTPEQDMLLLKCIQTCERLFYGLTNKEVRMLAYQMIVNEDMKIPEGWQNGLASIEWYKAFHKRHRLILNNVNKPDLIMHVRFKKSYTKYIEQNFIWEKKIVNDFYDNIEACFKKHPELAKNNRVFSLDETYVGIHIHPKKWVVDRDSNSDIITVCCVICANGTSLPPVIVKPYRELNEQSRANEFVASRGRLTDNLFIEVMQFFVKYSCSSPSNPSILIMDSDVCHFSSAALNLANDSGVSIVTVHPHINVLLQPLNGTIFDSFYKHYYEIFDSWAHVPTSPLDIGNTVEEAWATAATPVTIANAFKRCGINPYDRDGFTENDYIKCIRHATICYECKAREEKGRSSQHKYKDEANKDDEVPEEPQKQVSENEAESTSSQEAPATVETEKTKGDSANMPKSAASSPQDLDKLKRRLIRSIARLIKEKKTETEVWTVLKKECGANCKTLWLRMRSLTLKKLKRLLDADDRIEHVPAVARMTLTDWLLYDLVLVHEKIDVINRGSQNYSQVLENLFALVQRFEIEGRQGDDLAEAWTAATVDYNKKGHQCSPMLMQRRWFQMKELTRHKLYKFWFTYRGHDKRLDEANADPPTPLQRAISLRYPEIVTAPFPTWDERIEHKLVIMPEEFEVKMRKKVHMKPTDEAIPDVVIVEKKIDTITIESDSDFAEEDNMQDIDTNEPQTPIIVQVKTEPLDMENSIDITEHPVQPDKFQQAIERLEYEEDRILSHDNAIAGQAESETVMPYITNIQGATSSKENNFANQHIESMTAVEEKDLEIINSNSQQSIVIEDDDDEVSLQTTDKIQTHTPSNNLNNDPEAAINVGSYSNTTFHVSNINEATEEVFPVITSVAGGSQVQAKLEINTDFEEDLETADDEHLNYDEQEDIISNAPETKKSPMDLAREIVSESIFSEDGIEFADDGIEENDHNESNDSSESPENQNPNIEDTGAPKFDLKLLMTPVVYTTKLDDMTVYKGKSIYETICQKELVSNIIIESKPISANTVNVEQIKADNQLLEAEHSQEQVENAQDFDDNLFENETSNDEYTFIENKRVKVTSSLLKKPKVKSYHPIQLCKNPDFNMRLKRLTMGFFSHERNRMFLRACKPMTIDLSKAFESKLVDGTMYLKPSNTAAVKVEVEEECANYSVPVTIQPYTGPVKSLVQNPDVDRILQEELQKRMLERNKTINLPNISVVRKINQNLLMAQVAPMVVQAEKSTDMTVQNLIETVVEVNNSVPKPSPEISANMPIANTSIAIPHSMASISMPKVNTSAANPPIIPMNVPKVFQPVINMEKSKEVSTQHKQLDLSTPVLPMMPTKSSDDTSTEKKKKKQSVVQRPSWLTKIGPPHGCPEDSLLTLDTLYKILSTFDPSCVPGAYKSKSNKSAKKQIKKMQAAKQAEIEKPEAEEEVTDLTADNSDNKNVDIATTPASLDIQNSKPRTREDFCCWAKTKTAKLTGDSKIRLPKHKCKIRCRCCCREHLRQAEIESEIKILQKMQSRARDTYLETIEEVVQQSRDNNSLLLSHLLTDTNPSGVTTSTQQNTPQEVRQADLTSSNACNASISESLQENADIAISSKTVEVTMTINLEDDDDDNGNDVHVSESEPEPEPELVPINNEVTDNRPPKPSLRVYSAPPANKMSKIVESFSKILPRKGRGHPKRKHINKAVGTSAAPFLVPVELLQEPIMIKPLVPIEEPVKMTHTGGNVSTNVKEMMTKPVVTQKRIRLSHVESQKGLNLRNEIRGSKIPCTCRPKVEQDNLSPMLVVDGIGECRRHTSSRISKETRIYLSRKHLSSVRRPFFVGKDKILLTNIKPREREKAAQPVLLSSVTQSQSLPASANPSDTITLDLPAGVQVIFLPDGNVSYTLDPGTMLTSKELEDMKMILQIVQVQVNAIGYTVPEYEGPLADMIDDVEKSNITKDQHKDSCHINETTAATEKDKSNVKCNEIDQVNVIEDKKESQIYESKNGRNDASISKDTLNGNVPDEKDRTTTNVETPVNNDITNKNKYMMNQESENASKLAGADNNSNDTPTGSNRNLLSDLMEMSGILEDDVNNTKPEKVTVSASTDQTGQTVADQLTTNDQPRPQSPVHQISAQFNKTTYDLNPIVSFSELKYACENNGLFFKLDLNTGLIVAINVCIQKTPDPSSQLRPTEVIDLTEDQNESTNEIIDTSDYRDSTESLDNQSKMGNIYIMSKENPPGLTTILKNKVAMIKKFNSMRRVKLSQIVNRKSLLKRTYKRQRKQNFDEVVATIDMVDSDTPMEEEYLEQTSDDSDDEPLSKVAKKMRDIETSEQNKVKSRETLNIPDRTVPETDKSIDESCDVTCEPEEALVETNEVTLEPNEAVGEVGDAMNEETFNDSGDSMDIDDSIDFEAAIHAVDIPVNTNIEEDKSVVKEPVPTQLMLSGPMVSQPILLNDAFLNEDEDSQDDCILGV